MKPRRVAWSRSVQGLLACACAVLATVAGACVTRENVIDARRDAGGVGSDVTPPPFDAPADDDAVGSGDAFAEAGFVDGPVGVTCGAATCEAGQACCAATGACYDPRCLACCMERPDAATDGAARTPCRTAADCNTSGMAPARICVFGAAGCGVMGECYADFACGRPSVPYCGCDGRTFYDECAGPPQPWRSTGECPDAGAADAGASCSAPGDCGGGLVCCLSGSGAFRNRCYDPRCLACCM